MNYSEKRPHPVILEAYYEAWKTGLNSKEIYKTLFNEFKIPELIYHKAAPHFFQYCREQMKIEGIKGEFMIEKTEALEEEFLDYVRHGVPYDKAAKIMNIPMPTLLDVWFQDPVFKAEVDYALEKSNVAVVKALHKRAVGYDKTLTTYTKTITSGGKSKGLDNANGGGEMEVNSETTRTEHIQPNVEAAKFWLVNKSHEQWSPDGGLNKEGNKGKILESIDEMTKLTPEDEEALGEVKS
jgi:hypothetical protein